MRLNVSKGSAILAFVLLHISVGLDRVSASFSHLSMMSTSPASGACQAKHALYDMPVSNNGARCRVIIYKKGLSQDEVAIVPPSELGGLKSDEYGKVNPQLKMPAMVCTETGMNLAESDTIARYLLSTYSHVGPSFMPDNPMSNLISRIHDVYLSPIQGCMYKAVGPFGAFGTRKDALAEYQRQLRVIEDMMGQSSGGGMYMCGDEVSLADATVFPSMVFVTFMLPKFDIEPALPPKMTEWFENLKTNDAAFRRVHEEITGALQKWDSNGRWGTILGAGTRDTDPATLFDKIISKEIPATVVKEDDKILAFKDINPAAPAHVLVIPKDRNGLTRLGNARPGEHEDILGRLLVAASEISKDASLGFGDGARIVINDGPDGGQEVPHLHVHVLGGRHMNWPPG